MDQAQTSDSSASPPPVKVAMDPDVDFSRREYGGSTSYVLHHGQTGKFFRFGVEEYHIATMLDGTRTSKEVYDQAIDDGLRWKHEDVAKFIAQLVGHQLARTVSAAPSKAEPAKPAAKPSVQKQESAESSAAWSRRLPVAMSMIVSQRIPLADGAVAAAKAEPILGPMFSRLGTWLWGLLVISGLCVVYGNTQEFGEEIRRLFDTGLWLLLILIWCISKLLHELGHAVCASRHGVRVGRMGIMFFLLAPLAYVDVTDAWKLKRRFQRVSIALAGVYIELAVAAVAAWAWWLLPVGFCKHVAAQVFLVAGPATLLVNANPLLRLDGYYVLSDLLEIPNLRMHGRRQLGGMIESLMFSIPRPKSLLSSWRRPAATIHAACSVIFQFFWMTGLIIAASMWLKGLGIILAIAAFLLWGLLPLSRWIQRVWTYEPAHRFGLNRKRISLLGYALMLGLTVQHLSVSTSPLARRVPVVVRYQDEQISRATSDAFVDAVYAVRGQRVSKGMLLIELRQPELQLQRDVLADDLTLAEQREVQYRRQNRIAQATSESEKADSLRRQLAELNDQLDGLRVFALRDGLITSAHTERLLGSYVEAGDELIRVSDPNEKELLVTVDQKNTQAYQQAVGRDAKVRLRGGTKLTATAAPLRPRARQSLSHPALAATVGGPIAVEPATDDQQAMRMVVPQLESVTPLDPVTSAEVRAGQIGMMTIADDQSLISRIVDSFWPERQMRR